MWWRIYNLIEFIQCHLCRVSVSYFAKLNSYSCLMITLNFFGAFHFSPSQLCRDNLLINSFWPELYLLSRGTTVVHNVFHSEPMLLLFVFVMIPSAAQQAGSILTSTCQLYRMSNHFIVDLGAMFKSSPSGERRDRAFFQFGFLLSYLYTLWRWVFLDHKEIEREAGRRNYRSLLIRRVAASGDTVLVRWLRKCSVIVEETRSSRLIFTAAPCN